MTEDTLISKLELIKTASRENRLYVSDLILNNTYDFEELINIAFRVEDKLSIKAFWVLEFVVKDNFKLIVPYIDYLSKNAYKVIFGSAVRPLSKII